MKLVSTTLRNLALAGVATATLIACSTPNPSFAPTTVKNPIKVAESIERLELYARPNGLELSARDKFAVGQFLEGYKLNGDGPVYVNMPSQAKNNRGVQQAHVMVKTMMAQTGINPAALQAGQYQSRPNAPAPVVVSYRTLKTIPQDCRFKDDLSRSYNNQPHQSFGCFQSANLAAMVADPRQFLEPYATTTPNSQRRTVVYDKYIQGESTASERSERQTTTFESE